MIRPSNNPVTMEFGSTAPPYSVSSPHKGVDFGWRDSAGNENKTLVMPVSAAVTLVPNNGKDGNGVYFTGGGFQQGLLHTSEYLVKDGAFVAQGQPVAIMGATGKNPDGSSSVNGVHCHWAVRQGNTYVNGLDYVEEENMPSTVGDVEIDQMSWAYFGYGSPSNSQFTKDHTGDESNSFERFMFSHPAAVAYRNQVTEWRNKAELSGTPSVEVDGVPYVPKK